MRKEILFAIIAGVFFGLLVAFGIWRANTSFKNGNAAVTQNDQAEKKEEEIIPQNTEIAITKPLSNQVLSTSKVQIEGITSPNSYLVISNQDEDFITKSVNSGEFKYPIDLSAGINIISATSFNQSGQPITKRVLVVYSSEFGENNSENEEKTSTDSANDIRDKVQQKVNEVMNNPISYIGSITDISENAIQISNFLIDESSEDKNGEIKLISINDLTTFIDIKDKAKDIKVSDIAIGDFIAALGYKNNNNVIDAKRILVANKPEEDLFRPLMGKITKIDKKSVSIETLSDTYDLVFAKTWKGPEINELETGMQIIVVGTVNENAIKDIRTLETVQE